ADSKSCIGRYICWFWRCRKCKAICWRGRCLETRCGVLRRKCRGVRMQNEEWRVQNVRECRMALARSHHGEGRMRQRTVGADGMMNVLEDILREICDLRCLRLGSGVCARGSCLPG